MVEKNKNHPLKVFQTINIKASIWHDQKIINNDLVNVHTIKIERSYKNDCGEWINTNSFFVEDLPKVALVANEAYKYLRLKILENTTSDNNADLEEVKQGNET